MGLSKTEQKVLEGLLKDCYTTFGIDPSSEGLVEANANVPQLTKYYYKRAAPTPTSWNTPWN